MANEFTGKAFTFLVFKEDENSSDAIFCCQVGKGKNTSLNA